MSLLLKKYSEMVKIADNKVSEIFCAIERSTNRKVILKKIAVDPEDRSSSLKQFEYDTHKISAISHSNIISILDYWNDDDNFYIIMEYIEGWNFNTFISDKTFDRKIGLMIVLKALQALQHSHKNGILHCNIKPSNILISKTGRVVLSDFGLSLAKTDSKALRNGHGNFTNLLFMPPEQAGLIWGQEEFESENWTKTTSIMISNILTKCSLDKQYMQWDLWSCGVLLYLVGNGYYPFYNNDINNLLISIKYLDPPNLHSTNHHLTHPIVTLIEQCLNKKRYERPDSIDNLIEILQQHFALLQVTHIDEAITAFVRNKMGLPPIPAITDVPDDIADSELSSTTQMEFNFNENNLTEYIPSQQSIKQYFSGLFITLIKKCSIVNSIISKMGVQKRNNSFTTHFHNTHSNITRYIFILTMIAVIVSSAVLFVKTIKKDPVTTDYKPSEITTKHDSVFESDIKSTDSVIMPVLYNNEISRGMISKTLSNPVTKINSPSTVNPRLRQTKKLVDSTATTIAVKEPVVTKTVLPGILKITVNPPETRVFIDNLLFTRNEMENGKQVSPGKHHIVAHAAEHVKSEQTIFMESDKILILALNLKAEIKGIGQLHIYSYPWANLYIDDVLIGTTPTPTPISLAEDDHRVVLMQEGFAPYDELVTIKNGDITRLRVILKKIGEE